MNLNEMARAYYESIGSAVYANPVPVSPEDTALILIDVQNCLTKDYYMAAYQAAGYDLAPLMPALNELDAYVSRVLDNIGKVLAACREKGIRPIHVKIESYLPDGTDTGRLHATAGMCYPPSNPVTQFIAPALPPGGRNCLA